MTRQTLGRSELEVSRLALGSWRTFERISREDGLAVMRAAREHQLNFLDDARYDDETGTAPIPTGYSEVLFGELFRAAGWDRGATVVSNKLWWEFWPEQSAAAELGASLARMGFDYIDLIYANPPPEGLGIPDMVRSVGELVSSGKARAWGIVNWHAGAFLEASRAAEEQGVPPPCAAQLPYSLAQRDWVESAGMTAALEASGAGVVASFVMAGGVLTGKYDASATTGCAAGQLGKYDAAATTGRAAGQLDDPRYAAAREQGRRLRTVAQELRISPAALAISFALANPVVVSVLFGATSPAQIAENVTALEVDGATVQRITT